MRKQQMDKLSKTKEIKKEGTELKDEKWWHDLCNIEYQASDSPVHNPEYAFVAPSNENLDQTRRAL